MIVTDCFKGLIGFTLGNPCLDVLPLDMQGSKSGLYLDQHPLYMNAIVKTAGIAQMWDYVKEADISARTELSKNLLKVMRTKIDLSPLVRTVQIGEETGTGFLADSTINAVLTLPTKMAPDAVFLLTHIGIKATVVGGTQTINVVLKKNGTSVQAWQVTVTNNDNTRHVLETPYEIALDGSVYTFSYTFTGSMFPYRNAMDCGCEGVRANYSCFFAPFEGDAGGLRLLGEIRCIESLWPCAAIYGGMTGTAAATAYRALLLNFLFRKLQSSRDSRVNAFTLLKADTIGPVIAELNAEVQTALEDFLSFWQPGASCCYTAKAGMDKYSG